MRVGGAWSTEKTARPAMALVTADHFATKVNTFLDVEKDLLDCASTIVGDSGHDRAEEFDALKKKSVDQREELQKAVDQAALKEKKNQLAATEVELQKHARAFNAAGREYARDRKNVLMVQKGYSLLDPRLHDMEIDVKGEDPEGAKAAHALAEQAENATRKEKRKIMKDFPKHFVRFYGKPPMSIEDAEKIRNTSSKKFDVEFKNVTKVLGEKRTLEAAVAASEASIAQAAKASEGQHINVVDSDDSAPVAPPPEDDPAENGSAAEQLVAKSNADKAATQTARQNDQKKKKAPPPPAYDANGQSPAAHHAHMNKIFDAQIESKDKKAADALEKKAKEEDREKELEKFKKASKKRGTPEQLQKQVNQLQKDKEDMGEVHLVKHQKLMQFAYDYAKKNFKLDKQQRAAFRNALNNACEDEEEGEEENGEPNGTE